MVHSARAVAEAIYLDVLASVRGDRAVEAAIAAEGTMFRAGAWSVDLSDVQRIFVVGAGKASVGMARSVESVLGHRVADGVVVTKYGHGAQLRRIRVLEAAHPVPDATSVEGGSAILEVLAQAGKGDLVICLVSGGASALIEAPVSGLTLEDIRDVTSRMLRAGAPITELNTVRSCLSRIKAGGLARAAHPASMVTLVMSDVLGNPLDVIGSGPCIRARPDRRRAEAVLRARGLLDLAPPAVRMALASPQGQDDALPAPPADVPHVIVGDMWSALRAAQASAQSHGLRPLVLTGRLEGEAREAGRFIAALALDLHRLESESAIDCLILGGETTVTVRGDGLGGRCQEIACVVASALSGSPSAVVVAGGTDGTDGPTDAAGAVVDSLTDGRARAAGATAAEALATSDTYRYLDAAGALLRTGPTHSNVGDVIVVVLELPERQTAGS